MSAPADERAILESLEKLKGKVTAGMKAVCDINKHRAEVKGAKP